MPNTRKRHLRKKTRSIRSLRKRTGGKCKKCNCNCKLPCRCGVKNHSRRKRRKRKKKNTQKGG